MRWIRFVIAVVIGISVPLTAPAVAQAGAVQTLVDWGSMDATARGTTAGIAVLDRVTGQYTDNGPNARMRFGSASLVKLFIADSMLRRASLGQIALSPADRDRLGSMLRSSDDAAASNLWSRFGGSSIVTDVVIRYGLADTTPPPNPRYWGLTQVSAYDLVRFYDGMLSGRGGLAPVDRDFIVGQLRANTARGTDGVYQWFGLHDALPREPVLGLKQGWMCCFSDGFIWRHSTGLVGPDARYVVVVLTRDPGHLGVGHTDVSATRVVQRMFPAGLIPRVHGLIAERYYAVGGPYNYLGVPVRDEIRLVRGGAMSLFERGAIYWSPRTGARWVIGDILATYGAQGWERGVLGYPTTDEIPLVGGAVSGFEGGYVYWSPRTRAHWVLGAILGAYGAQGAERGPLGYPTSDEIRLVGGAVSRFEGGSIYWSPRTGPHQVIGTILRAYGAQGAERGPLRYPTTDEIRVPGGAVSRFQGGAMYWSPRTGAHWLGGALLRAYEDLGAQSSSLGFPTGDPRTVSGGTRVDFQRGSLTLTASGQVIDGNGSPVGPPSAAGTATAPPTAPTPPAPSAAPDPGPAGDATTSTNPPATAIPTAPTTPSPTPPATASTGATDPGGTP